MVEFPGQDGIRHILDANYILFRNWSITLKPKRCELIQSIIGFMYCCIYVGIKG
jgi:hypothetical protein